MDFTEGILWFCSWPVLIFVAYKFVMINLKHHAKMERLEILEKKFGKECRYNDPLLEKG